MAFLRQGVPALGKSPLSHVAAQLAHSVSAGNPAALYRGSATEVFLLRYEE